MDGLTHTEQAAGLALARAQAGPDGVIDPAMPGLSEAQALLATRALLGCGEAWHIGKVRHDPLASRRHAAFLLGQGDPEPCA